MRIRNAASPVCALITMCAALAQTPLGQEITYQARIQQGGAPLNSTADFQFRLFNAGSGGAQIGSTQSINNLDVVDGEISVQLNFGAGAFNGDNRFLEIALRSPAGGGSFTTLTPRQPLTAVPYALYALSGPGSGGPWAVSGNNIFNTNTGNVGVGTNAPQAKLHVAGGTAIFDRPGGAIRVTKIAGQLNADDLGIWNRNVSGSQPFVIADWNTGTKGVFVNTASGNVGVCVPDPYFRLTAVAAFPSDGISVSGTSPNSPAFSLGASGHGTSYLGMATDAFNFSSDAAPGDLILLSPQGKRLLLQNGHGSSAVAVVAGNVGIGTTAPQAKLHVNGTARVKVLEIAGADLAEKFPTSDPVEPGMIVAIDPENPGKLCLARGAYNSCVAGVVSGANNFSAGAVLGNLPGNEDAPPVALSGRVYVWCDAASSAIRPGDLLTTSSTPGHAMKATDRERSHGAIIGKAMTALERERTGLVLVLVNLQ